MANERLEADVAARINEEVQASVKLLQGYTSNTGESAGSEPAFMLLAITRTQFVLFKLKTSFWTSQHSLDELLLRVPKQEIVGFEFTKAWPIPLSVKLRDGRAYEFLSTHTKLHQTICLRSGSQFSPDFAEFYGI